MRKFFIYLVFCFAGLNTVAQPINIKSVEAADMVRQTTVKMTMADGTKLSTDVFLPVAAEAVTTEINLRNTPRASITIIPKDVQYLVYDSINGDVNPEPYRLPLILTRTPYNKASSASYGVFVSLLGYAYAMQDMRGAYASEGVYIPMYSDGWKKNAYHPELHHLLDVTQPDSPHNANKHEDGYQTVRYITDSLYRYEDVNNNGIQDTLLLSNGTVGMFGASALANSQYTAAAAHRINPAVPGLKSLFPVVGSADQYSTTLVQNGVYRQAIVEGWISNQLNTINSAALNDDDTGIGDTIHSFADYGLETAAQATKLAIGTMVDSSVNGKLPGYYPNAPFRASMDVAHAPVDSTGEGDADGAFSRYTNMNVPAYHLTGWWDIFIDGQISTFNQMRSHIDNTHGNRDMQKLIIGPWAHQTISSRTTGDITYPENVTNIPGMNIVDLENITNAGDDVFESELYKWFRHTLNERQGLGDPKFFIPESDEWQTINDYISVRIPAEDYIAPYTVFIGFLGGLGPLENIPVEISNNGDTVLTDYELPALDDPVFNIDHLPDDSTNGYFENTADVRFYVPGPVNDGIAANTGKGNYWFHTDSFPFRSEIHYQNFYLRGDGTLSDTAPYTNEESLSWVHDPDAPVLTVGGGNMIINTPDDGRRSQGPINLADPDLVNLTMEHPGVISFTSAKIIDSLSIIGVPKARLFASSTVNEKQKVTTNTDFFVRIVDVYPDGSSYFVAEGAVNARARAYARSIYNGTEDTAAPFSNIVSDSVYLYEFNLLPIAYTFGKDHRIKVLVSSSNHPRYMSSPNLPLNDNTFFRRKPNDGQTYTYDGTTMEPRIASNSLHFAAEMPSAVQLPVYGNYELTSTAQTTGTPPKIRIYPNPVKDLLHITSNNDFVYKVQLTDIQGRLLHSYTMHGNRQINLGNIPSGIYLLKVTGGADKKVFKVIVQ